jgi:elongation factor P
MEFSSAARWRIPEKASRRLDSLSLEVVTGRCYNPAALSPYLALFIVLALFSKQAKESEMIEVNELRKGVTFEFDGGLYKVLDYSHNKTGRGNASIRVKARNLRTGSTIEKTFQSGDRVQDARLDFHNVQYLYSDGDFYHFMDNDTFDQPAVKADLLGDSAGFLKGGMECKLTFYEGQPLDIELPTTVDLEVISSETAIRGDTATGVTKKVKVETGIAIQVPNFVKVGDVIRVDTRTGEYVTRV